MVADLCAQSETKRSQSAVGPSSSEGAGPSFADVSALRDLGNYLADTKSVAESMGTRGEASVADFDISAASAGSNFFLSVAHAEPFIPPRFEPASAHAEPFIPPRFRPASAHAEPFIPGRLARSSFADDCVQHSDPFATYDIPEQAEIASNTWGFGTDITAPYYDVLGVHSAMVDSALVSEQPQAEIPTDGADQMSAAAFLARPYMQSVQDTPPGLVGSGLVMESSQGAISSHAPAGETTDLPYVTQPYVQLGGRRPRRNGGRLGVRSGLVGSGRVTTQSQTAVPSQTPAGQMTAAAYLAQPYVQRLLGRAQGF